MLTAHRGPLELSLWRSGPRISIVSTFRVSAHWSADCILQLPNCNLSFVVILQFEVLQSNRIPQVLSRLATRAQTKTTRANNNVHTVVSCLHSSIGIWSFGITSKISNFSNPLKITLSRATKSTAITTECKHTDDAVLRAFGFTVLQRFYSYIGLHNSCDLGCFFRRFCCHLSGSLSHFQSFVRSICSRRSFVCFIQSRKQRSERHGMCYFAPFVILPGRFSVVCS